MSATPDELRELQDWRRCCALPLRAGTPDAPNATPQEVYQRVCAAEARVDELERALAEYLAADDAFNPESPTLGADTDRILRAREAARSAMRKAEGRE